MNDEIGFHTPQQTGTESIEATIEATEDGPEKPHIGEFMTTLLRKSFSKKQWWHETGTLELSETLCDLLRNMIKAYVYHVIPPHATATLFAEFNDAFGDSIEFAGKVLTATFHKSQGRAFFIDSNGSKYYQHNTTGN